MQALFDCITAALRLCAGCMLLSIKAKDTFDVILAMEILRKGPRDFFKALVPVRHQRSHLDSFGRHQFARPAISCRASVGVKTAGSAYGRNKGRLQEEDVSEHADVASLMPVPVKQHGGLLADQAGHLLEDDAVSTSLDEIVDFLSVGKFLNSLAQVLLSDVHRRSAEFPHQIQVDFSEIAHQDKPIEVQDISKILKKVDAGRACAANQNIPNAVITVEGITCARLLDTFAGVQHATHRLNQGSKIHRHAVYPKTIGRGHRDVFRKSPLQTCDSMFAIEFTLV